MAFRTSPETQLIYAYKSQQDRSKVEAPPQSMLIQLRESSDSQSAELLTYVPKNGVFDEKVLQLRQSMIDLICEVGACMGKSQLTVHLAVEYIDRVILLRNHFARFKKDDDDFESCFFEGHSINTVALTCLLLASKFNEIDKCAP